MIWFAFTKGDHQRTVRIVPLYAQRRKNFFLQNADDTKPQEEYPQFLRGLFGNGNQSGKTNDRSRFHDRTSPDQKYGTQSALNNFREHTMVSPRQMAEYVGLRRQR